MTDVRELEAATTGELRPAIREPKPPSGCIGVRARRGAPARDHRAPDHRLARSPVFFSSLEPGRRRPAEPPRSAWSSSARALIIMIGGMDLSLESTFGLAPMVAAWLMVPVAAFGAGTLSGPVRRHPRAACRGRRDRPDQRLHDREVPAQRLHLDTRDDDHPLRFPGRHRQRPVASRRAGRVELPWLALLGPDSRVAGLHRPGLHRRGAVPALPPVGARASMRSAATSRLRAPQAFASTASVSASTSPAACSRRSAV